MGKAGSRHASRPAWRRSARQPELFEVVAARRLLLGTLCLPVPVADGVVDLVVLRVSDVGLPMSMSAGADIAGLKAATRSLRSEASIMALPMNPNPTAITKPAVQRALRLLCRLSEGIEGRAGGRWFMVFPPGSGRIERMTASCAPARPAAIEQAW